MVWPHPLDVIQYARSKYHYNNVYTSYAQLSHMTITARGNDTINNVAVHTEKTQISLGISTFLSESSLTPSRKLLYFVTN